MQSSDLITEKMDLSELERKKVEIEKLLLEAKLAEIGRKEAALNCICRRWEGDESVVSNCQVHGWDDDLEAAYAKS
jgi:hypothetical protein